MLGKVRSVIFDFFFKQYICVFIQASVKFIVPFDFVDYVFRSIFPARVIQSDIIFGN